MSPAMPMPAITLDQATAMDEMGSSPSFIDTRARGADGQTSRDAAKHAATCKAAAERRLIAQTIHERGAMTAREVSAWTGLDYIETQRRISECGLRTTEDRRGVCYVWSAG
jgi:hypothetical protein